MSKKILTFHKGRSECVELQLQGDLLVINYEDEDGKIEVPAFVMIATLADMIKESGLEDDLFEYVER